MSKVVQREQKRRQGIQEAGKSEQGQGQGQGGDEALRGEGARPKKPKDANRSEIAGAGRHVQHFSRM